MMKYWLCPRCIQFGSKYGLIVKVEVVLRRSIVGRTSSWFLRPNQSSKISAFLSERKRSYFHTSNPIFTHVSNKAQLLEMIGEQKTYEETISALNGLQSNAATIAKSTKSPLIATKNKKVTLECLEKLGYELQDLSKLNSIHVAGTKGKGSTCAFAESILRSHNLKTGFFSSPHLISVRERIRINGKPLSRAAFVTYFWEVYNKLQKEEFEHFEMPSYFMFLTIMSFHVFLKEQVHVAIIEVGVGGEYDCTNIMSCPAVVGITLIDIDHVNLLGDSVEKIAWQKAGIFKNNVPAFTVPQPLGVMEVFQNRAKEAKCPIEVCLPIKSYSCKEPITLGISGEVQESNASLAVQLVKKWLEKQDSSVAFKNLPKKENGYVENNSKGVQSIAYAKPFVINQTFAEGLKCCSWPGRFQQIVQGNVTYYLDGAHTVESVYKCATWFLNASSQGTQHENSFKMLLFNCTGERKPEQLLTPFLDLPFDFVAFVSNTLDGTRKVISDQSNFNVDFERLQQQCNVNSNIWHQLKNDKKLGEGEEFPQEVLVFPCIKDVLSWIQSEEYNRTHPDKDSKKFQVLITGSLHLVGGVLSVIEPDLYSN